MKVKNQKEEKTVDLSSQIKEIAQLIGKEVKSEKEMSIACFQWFKISQNATGTK